MNRMQREEASKNVVAANPYGSSYYPGSAAGTFANHTTKMNQLEAGSIARTKMMTRNVTQFGTRYITEFQNFLK